MKTFLWLIISLIRILLVYGFGFFICLIFPLYVASEYFKPILDVSYGNDLVGTGSSNFMVFVLRARLEVKSRRFGSWGRNYSVLHY